MMIDNKLYVREFSETHSSLWDNFCKTADQGTLLHTRRFLSYHGDRFLDCSLMIEAQGNLLGVFPAAVNHAKTNLIVSHPGVTYGGIVHAGALRGERMIEAIKAICQHYLHRGYSHLVYKAVPTFYHRRPAQDDLYALYRLGAVRTRCDISSTIDLGNRYPVTERRRRSLKKAQKAGVTIAGGVQYLPAMWDVLAENLERKHGIQPVHTVDEMHLLMQRFPNEIKCLCGMMGDLVVAGTILFSTSSVDHAQYIASCQKGYDVSALDAVFQYCIESSIKNGKRWFDFGISTEDQGTIMNEGLYRFKSEFGGGGFIHEFFEINLEKADVYS